MNQIRFVFVALVVLGSTLCSQATAGADGIWLSRVLFSSEELERNALLQARSKLPEPPEPHFTERLGYHSGYSTSPDTVEWVQIDLGREEHVDAVVLIAATSPTGSKDHRLGYGFPLRFRVEISNSEHGDRNLIADYTQEDFPNPGALPVYIPCQGQGVRFVRITATRLFSEEGRALLALGELMLLQGNINIATRVDRLDFTYSRTMGALPVWGLMNLRDCHTVLGPPEGNQPSPTKGYATWDVSLPDDPKQERRWVIVDLGKSYSIEEIRLFPALPEEFAHRPGFGWPQEMRVELTEDPEFEQAWSLRSFPRYVGDNPSYPMEPGDNAISFPASGKMARYVRIEAIRLFNNNGKFNFAMSELQAWSDNTNVALGKPVTSFDSKEKGGWSRAALVDGFTSRANIVDYGPWISGLSNYREITNQLTILDERLAAHKKLVGTVILWSTWIAGLALLLTLLALNFRQQRMRRQEMELLRIQISQDLHDDIGSSLGTIALISDDAMQVSQDPQLHHELSAIRETSMQTLDSMRDIVRLVRSGRYGTGDLQDHLQEICTRMLQTLPHTFQMTSSTKFGSLNQLSIQRRRDLVLMFKEALHNLIRHSRATRAAITLNHSSQGLTLTLEDNGRGFDQSLLLGEGMGLLNLQRRATKHGGIVTIRTAPGAGTTLTMMLPYHD